jgi:hypothetical protein
MYAVATQKIFPFEYHIQGDELRLLWGDSSLEWISYDRKVFYLKNQYHAFKSCISDSRKNISSYVFIHACILAYDDSILEEQLELVLRHSFTHIYIGIVGMEPSDPFLEKYRSLPHVSLLYVESNIIYYEIRTINEIQKFAQKKEEDVNILYIHTKGVRQTGNKKTIRSWRKMMEYFLVEQKETCISFLEEYDTIGCNCINEKSYNLEKVSVNGRDCTHYSGNFWWGKSSYLKQLPLLEYDLSEESIHTRCRAENWVLSGKGKIGIIYQDIKRKHPYHLYVFEEEYKSRERIITEMKRTEASL